MQGILKDNEIVNWVWSDISVMWAYAEKLGKSHDHVKRDLDKILMSPNVDADDFKYIDSRGRI